MRSLSNPEAGVRRRRHGGGRWSTAWVLLAAEHLTLLRNHSSWVMFGGSSPLRASLSVEPALQHFSLAGLVQVLEYNWFARARQNAGGASTCDYECGRSGTQPLTAQVLLRGNDGTALMPAGSASGVDPLLTPGLQPAALSPLVGAAAPTTAYLPDLAPSAEYYRDEVLGALYRVRVTANDVGAFETATSGAVFGPEGSLALSDGGSVEPALDGGSAGAGPGSPGVLKVGCGCQVASPGGLALLALAWAAGRRPTSRSARRAAGRTAHGRPGWVGLFVGALLASTPAGAAPLLTAPTPVEPPAPVGAMCFNQAPAHLARLGSRVVAVWQDYRHQELQDVSLARWEADGGLVDAAPFSLTRGGWLDQQSSVSCSANGCLVVYQHSGADGFGGRAVLLDSLGAPVGPPFGVTAGQDVRAAAAPNSYLVVAQDSEVQAMPLDSSGTPTLGSALVLSAPTTSQTWPAAAWDGAAFLVVWVDVSGGGQVRGRRVSAAGVALGPEFAISGASNAVDSASVDADPAGGFAVTWPTSTEVRAARVSTAGVVLDAPSLVVASERPAEPSQVLFDGTNWLFHWYRTAMTTTYGLRRLAPGGGFVDAAPVGTRAINYGLDVAVLGSGYLFSGFGSASYTLALRPVTSQFTMPASPWPRPQIGPAHSFLRAHASDGGALVSWQDTRDDDLDLGLTWVGSDGTFRVLSPPRRQGLQNLGDAPDFAGAPLFVWYDDTLYPEHVQAITPDGRTLFDAPLGIGGYGELGQATATTGAGVIIASAVRRSGGVAMDTALVRFDGGTTPLADISPLTPSCEYVALASAASGAALAYIDQSVVGADVLNLQFLDAEGRPLGLARRLLVTPRYRLAPPALDFDGTRALLLMTDTDNSDLRAWYVSPADADPADAGTVLLARGESTSEVAVAFDGREHLVLWPGASTTDAGDIDLFGVRVDQQGHVVASVFPVATGPGAPQFPVIASPRPGEFVIAWSESTGDASRGVVRRWLSLPAGSSCQASAECEAGDCAAGRCCATPGTCATTDAGDSGIGDGGIGDRGSGADGGQQAVRLGVGCGCGQGSTAGCLGPLVLALAFGARRRRRRTQFVSSWFSA